MAPLGRPLPLDDVLDGTRAIPRPGRLRPATTTSRHRRIEAHDPDSPRAGIHARVHSRDTATAAAVSRHRRIEAHDPDSPRAGIHAQPHSGDTVASRAERDIMSSADFMSLTDAQAERLLYLESNLWEEEFDDSNIQSRGTLGRVQRRDISKIEHYSYFFIPYSGRCSS